MQGKQPQGCREQDVLARRQRALKESQGCLVDHRACFPDGQGTVCLETPGAPLNGRRGLDWHKQVIEKSVLGLGVGLKAQAWVLWVPGAQRGALRHLMCWRLGFSHLQLLSTPRPAKLSRGFSLGPRCPDSPGRSRRPGAGAHQGRSAW